MISLGLIDMEITKNQVRDILYSYGIGSILTSEDQRILEQVLQKHHHAAKKIGTGVDYFSVNDGFYGTRCFYVHRTDGTRIDFSFLSCFTKPKNDFAKAARKSVEPFIMNFRYSLPEKFNCPILGIPIMRKNCHVDHIAPLTFKNIIAQFLDIYKPQNIQYDYSGIGVSFIDKQLEKEFIQFHAIVSNLRGISKKANLSLPKT